MPITDTQGWEVWQKNNQDPYGGACVKVAREVMRMLDADPAPITDTHKMICDADDAAGVGGITGFMASCVAKMVSDCHSRGGEFRRAWNLGNQIRDEGEKANESGGILNPAVLILKD